MGKSSAPSVGAFCDEALAGAISAVVRAFSSQETSELPLVKFASPINTIINAARRGDSAIEHLSRKVAQLEARIVIERNQRGEE